MKTKAKQTLSEAVDLILWEQWDPFGVNAIPAARNEYSHYVRSVVQLLTDGADAFKLTQHLYSLECGGNKRVPHNEHLTRVAEALLHAYNECA